MLLDQLRRQYREQILALAEQYKAENVRVFGSVARGEEKPGSDVDILVHFKPGASLLDESGLEIALGDMLGRRVDLIGDTAIKDLLRENILNGAVPL